ncbi:MAG: YlxR family protein [Candidatus Adiutrix sp.]|jgi:predicted RNA-binding protein YlxR (DUF448 family)|nr:YlxR family protein [Candidatus Adiutrix sp.]
MAAKTDGGGRPERTCLGCRAKKPQSQLARLALTASDQGESRVVWDRRRNLGGRGAWLCADRPGCLAAALKRNAVARAFKRPVIIDALSLEPDDGENSM